MKKRITLVLEVESDDEFNLTDEFIRNDLETEINCASNSYDFITMTFDEIKNSTMNDLIRKIELILIETGQHDKEKFKLGEIIKYTPHEVAEILRSHVDELNDVLTKNNN